MEITAALGRLTGVFFASRQIRRYQDVSRRIVLPISKEIVYLPHGQLVNLPESPSGSGGDVAVNKRPLDYTGTGIGSPAAAFLRPETSSTALKSALKSSKVSPFSN